jgi:ketosteroid isomerase-like protein
MVGLVPFPRPEETVRLMFEARNAGDIRRVCALLHPDIEAVSAVDGTLRGIDAVREYLASQHVNGHRTEVMAYRIEAQGDEVIAHGRVRIVDGGALADSPAAWRFVVRDGVVMSISPVAA